MTRPSVSIVIVSRHRADALTLCLTAVARLSYPSFEVVVVADPDGLRAIEALPFIDRIKTVSFDEANISAARNRGIAQSAGDVVAFLDDDAVPETRWLDHLIGAFDDPDVAAAGGYVLGRNGISIQWASRIVDRTGQARDLPLVNESPIVLRPPPDSAVKTEGTNMAIRRDVLASLGGFDPAFQFYLDETDLNMRMAEFGLSTAIVPLARVHHGFAASANRRADRAVRDLRQIAASTVVYLRKHCPASRHAAVLQTALDEQRTRLFRQLVAGLLEPGDVRRLLKSWEMGLEDGRARLLTDPRPLPQAQEVFLPFQSLFQKVNVVLGGFATGSRALRKQAGQTASEGRSVSLFVFSRTMLFHRVQFHPDGFWEQTGGLWGRSDRKDKLFSFWSLKKRVQREVQRIGAVRFDDPKGPDSS